MNTEQELLEQLDPLRDSATVIVGIGNTLKGDDAAGPLLCEQLAGKVSAEVIDAGTVPENYIQTIARKKPQTLLIVDAMDFGAEPGEIGLFKAEQLGSAAISTHTLSPRLFVDLIRRDVEIDVHFIGIQPVQTQLGKPVSAQVAEAIKRLSHILAGVFPVNA